MSDLLGLALGGVRAARTALETVGDNVANAATPGYVRRRPVLASLAPARANSPFEKDPVAAGGVEVRGIARAVDLILVDSLRRAESQVALLGAAERWLALVEASLSGPASLARPLEEFFASLSDLTADPASLPVRETVLARARQLAARFNASAGELARLVSDLDAEAEVAARQLTSLARSLADVNAQLRRATAGGGAAVSLADTRDRLLTEMASLVAIDVRFSARGEAEVRVGDAGGVLVVDGQRSEPILLRREVGGGFGLAVGPDGAETAPILGGALLGLTLAGRRLADARERLDQLALELASDLNAAHQAGVDLAGADGQPLFATRRLVVTPAAGNGGGARIEAVLADGAAPPPLRLTWNAAAGQWRLARADDSAAVSGSFPLSLDGVTVTGAGPPRAGDLFRIETQQGAAGLDVRPLPATALAAAPRFLADPLASNRGAGRVDVRIGPLLDPPPVPPLAPPFRVEVGPSAMVTLRDAADVVVATGAVGDWLIGDGFEVRISGDPAEGDLFRIRRAGPGSGANGNALALLAVRDCAGALGTPAEAHEALLTALAVPLAEVRARLEAARESRNAAAEAVAEASGVDLDREAADMLRFQQAYQANARLIQTARDTFQALLEALR